jgi:hypothetical protein
VTLPSLDVAPPALLYRTSRLPKVSTAALTAASTCSGFATSIGTNLASPPASLIAAAVASPWSRDLRDHHARALAREQQRRGTADAAAATRDQRHLALQPRHARLPRSSLPTRPS